MLLLYVNDNESLEMLLATAFSSVNACAKNVNEMMRRAILTPRNDFVDEINEKLIKTFPGTTRVYKSFDQTLDSNEQGLYEDFLHTLTPNGLPPHILTLKPNCPIMLLRNIDPPEGLSNGTRLICRNLDENVIDAEIAVGQHQGKIMFLPRIPLQPSEADKYPIAFQRKQFPVRLCFAMTINKAQGQTLDFVGLYLPNPVFSHGQLYVALSRATNAESIKILVKPTNDDESTYDCTANIVYQELLKLANSG